MAASGSGAAIETGATTDASVVSRGALLFQVDSLGYVRSASQTFLAFAGIDHTVGRHFTELVQRSRKVRTMQSLRRALDDTRVCEEIHFGNGCIAWTELVRIRSQGGPPTLQGRLLDIEGGRQYPASATAAPASVPHVRNECCAALQLELEQTRTAYRKAVRVSRMDAATGILNRVGLDRAIRQAIQESGTGSSRTVALVYVDLDDFKRVNDSFGHAVGDSLLRRIARRLKACGPDITAGRLGGDEFAVLVTADSLDASALETALETLRSRVFSSVKTGGLVVGVSGSVGVTFLADADNDPEWLHRRADLALIEAKRRGKGQICVYDDALEKQRQRRHTLEHDLAEAIGQGSLAPVFQPIVPTRSSLELGVEVLARWDHPELGAIPPSEFIQIAQDCDLLAELDLCIAGQACTLLAPLLTLGHIGFISLNVSALELERSGHLEALFDILDRAGIPCHRICAEITESDMVCDIEKASAAISYLKSRGMKIALDDYGTGYSNLSALLKLPIDRIKIDRSLISALERDERSMRLVLSLTQLARVIGADLVAEGVETFGQAAVAHALGCHFLQGFALGRPVSADELTSWANIRQKNSVHNSKYPWIGEGVVRKNHKLSEE